MVDGGTIREASVITTIPLHGGPGIDAGAAVKITDDLFVAYSAFTEDFDFVFVTDVGKEILGTFIVDVAHADFIPIVDEGGAIHK